MHANPGVYAVLAGSGVSRAAKIPTGWEITLDLIRKLAALRKEKCEPDPEQWYQHSFNKEADYSDLLDAVCKTRTERQQLLRTYVGPTAEDREERTKQPTAAHHAIAGLTAQGFVRVILTTNFDGLFETALENADVEPVVLSTRDQIEGALPLIHTRCCLVKLTTVPVESRGGAYPVGIGGSSGAFATGPQSDSREHVSSPRSPNPAGRSPAPGSPVESCDSHTGSRARPADGSRERWHHARTLALAGRCVVRPVDALATATMQVVPFACACDDSPEFLLISGVLGRRPLP